MSRVHRPKQKYMNTATYSSDVTGPSKVVRMKGENPNFRKAMTLSSWLFLKYDMSYKTFRNKSKAKRDELRAEYEKDTGNKVNQRKDGVDYE